MCQILEKSFHTSIPFRFPYLILPVAGHWTTDTTDNGVLSPGGILRRHRSNQPRPSLTKTKVLPDKKTSHLNEDYAFLKKFLYGLMDKGLLLRFSLKSCRTSSATEFLDLL